MIAVRWADGLTEEENLQNHLAVRTAATLVITPGEEVRLPIDLAHGYRVLPILLWLSAHPERQGPSTIGVAYQCGSFGFTHGCRKDTTEPAPRRYPRTLRPRQPSPRVQHQAGNLSLSGSVNAMVYPYQSGTRDCRIQCQPRCGRWGVCANDLYRAFLAEPDGSWFLHQESRGPWPRHSCFRQ